MSFWYLLFTASKVYFTLFLAFVFYMSNCNINSSNISATIIPEYDIFVSIVLFCYNILYIISYIFHIDATFLFGRITSVIRGMCSIL